MAIPPDGQTAVDALKHVDQSHVTGFLGWLIGGMASLIALLLGWDRAATKRAVRDLFKWKDEVVDPALQKIPEKYVGFKECARHHAAIVEMHEAMSKAQGVTHDEVLHVRRLLEAHVSAAEKRNGGGP